MKSVVLCCMIGLLLRTAIGQTVDSQQASAATKSRAKAPDPRSADQIKREQQQDRNKTVRIFKVVCGGLIFGFLAGALLGKAVSPKYDDPSESPRLIQRYVAEHCTFERDAKSNDVGSCEDFVVYRDAKGGVKAVGPHGSFVFSYGIISYLFNTRSKQIEKRSFSDTSKAKFITPRQGFTFKETTALLIGSLEAYSLKKTGELLAESASGAAKDGDHRAKLVLGTIVGCLSGVLFGFWLTFERRPKCGEPLFSRLLDDRTFWEGVMESSFISPKTFNDAIWCEFVYSESGVRPHMNFGGYYSLSSLSVVEEAPPMPKPDTSPTHQRSFVTILSEEVSSELSSDPTVIDVGIKRREIPPDPIDAEVELVNFIMPERELRSENWQSVPLEAKRRDGIGEDVEAFPLNLQASEAFKHSSRESALGIQEEKLIKLLSLIGERGLADSLFPGNNL